MVVTQVMYDKICLITGANAGIGFETARGIAKSGGTVVLACRNRHRGESAVNEIRADSGNDKLYLMLCDLSSQADIRRMVAEFHSRFDRLHVLINNAAMYTPTRSLSADGLELQFASNYLSCFLLTHLLLDLLKTSAPARIVNLSTINHFDVSLDLDDLQSEQIYEPKVVHVRSKLAVILFTYELARRLQGTGVTANCLHPGVIATNLLGEVRNVPPEQRFTEVMGGDPLEAGARTPVFLATSAEVEGVSGKYFDDCKAVPSSSETYDEEKTISLWTISEKLTGMNPISG